jgi:NAD(P)-dependent dehydrogenase (short-subunit alcohol dehydrogenase family)
MAELTFQNKRVCVTGAGRGIGKSLALRLAQLGAQVIAVSKSDENLKQLVAEVIIIEDFEYLSFCLK